MHKWAAVLLFVIVASCTTVTVQIGRENANEDNVEAKRSIERTTVEPKKERKE